MTAEERKRRFTTALHECAHLVTALAQQSIESGTAYLIPAGGGYASYYSMAQGTAEMVITAAGSWGGKLIRVFPVPPEDPPQPTQPEAGTIAAIRAEAITKHHEGAFESATPDSVQIARYCIEGHETEPRFWAWRYRHINAKARLAVWKHRDAIHKAAQRLYRDGSITITFDDLQAHDVQA